MSQTGFNFNQGYASQSKYRVQPYRSGGANQRQNASFSGGRSLKQRHYGGLTTSATTNNNSKTRVQRGPSEDGY